MNQYDATLYCDSMLGIQIMFWMVFGYVMLDNKAFLAWIVCFLFNITGSHEDSRDAVLLRSDRL